MSKQIRFSAARGFIDYGPPKDDEDLTEPTRAILYTDQRLATLVVYIVHTFTYIHNLPPVILDT